MTHAKAVILVDDEREILASFRRLLRNEPYEVRVTTSPFEALEWVARGEASLVISDQRMPEMAGTELLEKIGARSPGTARALLTGFNDGELPAPLVLRKPWDGDALKAMIRRLLEIPP